MKTSSQIKWEDPPTVILWEQRFTGVVLSVSNVKEFKVFSLLRISRIFIAYFLSLNIKPGTNFSVLEHWEPQWLAGECNVCYI